MTAPGPRRPLFPFSSLWPLAGGVALGLLLRLVFSGSSEGNRLVALYAMTGSFIYLGPFAVGALTAWLSDRRQPQGLVRHAVAGMAATSLLVLVTLVVELEGLICAILVLPLFAVLGGLGAITMALACRACRAWRRPGRPMAVIAVLPVMMAAVEAPWTLPDHFGRVEHAVLIQAPADRVWDQLLDTPAIRPEEMAKGWIYRIGVPLPHFGRTERRGAQLVRHVEMGKGIRFEQVATEWSEARSVRWTYRFGADAFPPGALDDHVRIGGRHFDLIDTVYRLEPVGEQTRLHVTMHYRVSTRFNWYADALAQASMGNFESVALRLYASRAEAAHRRTPAALLPSAQLAEAG